MITELDIHLPLRKAVKEQARRKAVAQQLGISPHRVLSMRLLKDSIDARRRPICKQLRLQVGIDEELPPVELPRRDYAPLPSGARRVIIVGSGPGGLFAALRCLELGLRPIVLERGKQSIDCLFPIIHEHLPALLGLVFHKIQAHRGEAVEGFYLLFIQVIFGSSYVRR